MAEIDEQAPQEAQTPPKEESGPTKELVATLQADISRLKTELEEAKALAAKNNAAPQESDFDRIFRKEI